MRSGNVCREPRCTIERESKSAVFLAFAALPSGFAIVRCEETPPRLWRHQGCERWDCGDLGTEPSGCRGHLTGSQCVTPDWNCSTSGRLQPSGAFSCIGGHWADLLPTCLGDTDPGVPGGTWQAKTHLVRAIILKINISWDVYPTAYRPELCESTTLTRGYRCHRASFGELIERQLWLLFARPLQAALCEPQVSYYASVEECTGAISRSGDRIRIAGVSGGPYVEEAEITSDAGNTARSLLLYIDVVPFRATDAERLLADINAWATAFQGLEVSGADLWPTSLVGDNFEIDRSVSTRASSAPAAWLESGFSKLRRAPENFNIKPNAGFEKVAWLPNMHFGISEPYIINRLNVPIWSFLQKPKSSPDVFAKDVATIGRLEAVLIRSICGVLGAAWGSLVLLRFCFWPLLFGRRRHWQLGQTVRGVSLVALLSDAAEVTGVSAVFGAIWLLAGRGVFNEAAASDLRRPHSAALLLPFVAVVVFPSTLMAWHMFRGTGGENVVPNRRGSLCCCRLRRSLWLRLFAASVLWHGVFLTAATIVAVMRLAGASGDAVQDSARAEAQAMCSSDLERRCADASERQLPDFGLERREFCALDCSEHRTTLSEVTNRLEVYALRLQVVIGAWGLFARLLQLCLLYAADLKSDAKAAGTRALGYTAENTNVSDASARSAVAAKIKASARVETAAAEAALSAASEALSSMQHCLTDGPARDNDQEDYAAAVVGSETGRCVLGNSCSTKLTLATLAAHDEVRPPAMPPNTGADGDEWTKRIAAALAAVEGTDMDDGSVEEIRPASDGKSGAQFPEATPRATKTALPTPPVSLRPSAEPPLTEAALDSTSVPALRGSPDRRKAERASKDDGVSPVMAALSSHVVAGKETGLLSFAQQIARQVSKDNLSEATSEAGTERSENMFAPKIKQCHRSQKRDSRSRSLQDLAKEISGIEDDDLPSSVDDKQKSKRRQMPEC